MPNQAPAPAITRYGPRKIGEKEFKKQQDGKELSSREATVYGKRKGTEPSPEPEKSEPKKTAAPKKTEPQGEAPKKDGPETGEPKKDEPKEDGAKTAAPKNGEPQGDGDGNPFNPAGDANNSGYTTIDELSAALEQDPTLLDLAIEAEFVREDGVRKGAVKVLLGHELNREDGPRARIVSKLEENL